MVRNTAAGDKYTGLGRFGRVIDQVWRDATDTFNGRYQYGKDRVGNQTFRNNPFRNGAFHACSARQLHLEMAGIPGKRAGSVSDG